METETVDIHLGISPLTTKQEIEDLIEGSKNVLVNGPEYELFQDEGKDNWEVWGEGRETWSDPWHLIIRVEYPNGLSNILIHHDYRKFEAILSDWMRPLHHDEKELVAVITDSDDWSTYRGGPVRSIPA